MNNTFIFLRHGSTQKDPSLPIHQWVLKNEAVTEINKLSSSPDFDTVDLIYSSSEKKAIQTAEPFANRLKKAIIQEPLLGEINRPGSEKISTEEYENLKRKIFENLDYTTCGWETANHALNRYIKAIDKINTANNNKTILVVSHGTVMTLYFAFLMGQLNNIFSRWHDLGFGTWGIVYDNNKVIKDIV